MLGDLCHRVGLRWAAAGLFALMVGLPLATAAEAGKPADAAKAAALAHFEAAKRLFQVREYSRALDEYKEAYLAKPDPAFLVNIGLCHRKLGQNAQAIDFYQQYLKKAPLDDPNRRQIEARIADIHAEEQETAARASAATSEAATTTASAAVSAEPAVAAPTSAPVPTAAPAPVEAAAVTEPAPTPAGVDLAAAAQPDSQAQPQPVYKTWWFWTGVGAVVVGGAVTTALLMKSGGGTQVPNTSLGNRPVFP